MDDPAVTATEPEPVPVGDDVAEEHHSLMDRLRGTGVGMEDPNIIGEAGPTDVAPGADPPFVPLDEELPPEEPYE